MTTTIACPSAAPLPRSLRAELLSLLTTYRWQLLATYALFNVENWLRLIQPLLLGWAINDLLMQSYSGLVLFAAGHLLHLVLRWIRQMYDTRTFTHIYGERAPALVLRLHRPPARPHGRQFWRAQARPHFLFRNS